MIFSIIVVCNLSGCLNISDTMGPYRSIDHCLLRADKMYNDTIKVLPKHRLISVHCTKSQFLSKGIQT